MAIDPPITIVLDIDGTLGAAGAAGIPTLAVLTGGFSEAELRDAGAADVVRSIGELRKDRGTLRALAQR